MKKAIKIALNDNVAVSLCNLTKGTVLNIDEKEITLLSDISRGHKFALKNIKNGCDVIKYGYPIGRAKERISVGNLVHLHNLETKLAENNIYSWKELKAKKEISEWKKENPPKDEMIQAFVRENNKIAIRNEIWIIPTVGCVNGVAEKLRDLCIPLIKNTSIDGVHAWTHPYGCSQTGDDHARTKKILAALVKHPHAGGVLVLGLGCENNTMEGFITEMGEYNKKRTRFMVAQDEKDEIYTGKKLLKELIENASQDRKETVSINRLIVGMKCGGSDGLSGITANPLIGRFCDFLIATGGTVTLTEVPEMFGAEQVIYDRCGEKEIFLKAESLIENFKEYYRKHNQVIYENPSPGNKSGGISTLEDKSLGCVQKGGKAPISDIIKYGDIINSKGLILLEGPGNDIVSSTAMAAAGVNLILFSTGRGTPLGGPVPTIKISTNNELFEKKNKWIDFDASKIMQYGFEKTTEEFISFVLKIASGEKTKNEKNGYSSIAIFKTGVTL